MHREVAAGFSEKIPREIGWYYSVGLQSKNSEALGCGPARRFQSTHRGEHPSPHPLWLYRFRL